MTDLRGAGVVVTGAGAGIGAALARKLAAEGASVVVNDLNEPACRAVAEEIGGVAAPGDAASEAGVAALVATAREALGEIDVYCANAGIGVGASEQAPDDEWEQTWNVNVMAHVRAARALMPAWLERGRGHFVPTVSAAGLLTMLGSASYSVTKHAALAFAEWLSATYGGRGITVQALCPLGVRTDMLRAAGEIGKLILEPDAIEPEEVADVTARAIAADDGQPFLILPHPQAAQMYAARAGDTDHWLERMRELQAQLPT
jgi:NAD(P)-dependent dehydrogenase (short-subunit alcohol dehydrogenase family)